MLGLLGLLEMLGVLRLRVLLLALAAIDGPWGHRASICHRICQSRIPSNPLSSRDNL